MFSQINDNHLENFSPTLKTILTSELKAGNSICETSEGWPELNSIMVFLRKPFSKDYSIPGVEFRPINDPHWWKSEYYHQATNHVLACKFE